MKMTRLEFIGLESINEMKEVLNALVKGEDYLKSYTDKEKNNQTKVICRNNRIYLGSNFSISFSKANDGKCYLGVDYLSSDDRINLNRNKNTSSTDLF